MFRKNLLKKENLELKEKIEELYDDIIKENVNVAKSERKYNDLNREYLILLTKYEKLLKEIAKKDTEIIVFQGKAYGLTKIDYHKEAGEDDIIIVEAIEKENEKGLINNLSEAYQKLAKEFNRLMFGDDK